MDARNLKRFRNHSFSVALISDKIKIFTLCHISKQFFNNPVRRSVISWPLLWKAVPEVHRVQVSFMDVTKAMTLFIFRVASWYASIPQNITPSYIIVLQLIKNIAETCEVKVTFLTSLYGIVTPQRAPPTLQFICKRIFTTTDLNLLGLLIVLEFITYNY